MFDGKIALITGAASGIGAATAVRLAAEGAAGLVLIDTNGPALDVAAEAASQKGANILTRVHDVANPAAWRDTMAATDRTFGRLDLAVANAGVATGGDIVDQSLDDWRRVMSVNLDGVYLTIQAALRAIADGGAIVAVSSASALKAEPGTSAYAVSKAAVLQLVKVAAREAAARRVRVNAILPGGVKTPIWRAVPFFNEMVREVGDEDLAFDKMGEFAPLGRYAEAEEVAGMIAFLLSDASATMTGAALVCDGGYSV